MTVAVCWIMWRVVYPVGGRSHKATQARVQNSFFSSAHNENNNPDSSLSTFDVEDW